MMRKGDEMDDERLMSDDAVEDAVLRYLDESPEVVSGMAPSRDLWPDIEARIGARVLPLGRDSVQVHRVHRMHRPAWLAMAAAAAFLVASTAGVTYVLTKRIVPASATSQVATTPAATTPVATTPVATTPAATRHAPDSVPLSPSEVPTRVASATPTQGDATKGTTREVTSHSPRTTGESDESREAPRATSGMSSRGAATSLASYPTTGSDEARVTYDDEITRLHGVLDARRDQLDPATVATVERNLHIIDDAISQARTALARDPHSRMLNEQLDRTLAKKTQLLRAATLLPSV